MKLLLDHDPLTGEKVFFGSDPATNKVVITHEQDVSEHLRRAHAQSVDDDLTKNGIKNDFWKYASIPNIIILEMKQKHGVDINNKHHWPRVFKLLNTEYSRFKTTGKMHKLKDV